MPSVQGPAKVFSYTVDNIFAGAGADWNASLSCRAKRYCEFLDIAGNELVDSLALGTVVQEYDKKSSKKCDVWNVCVSGNRVSGITGR